ncbi:hypothetical protein CVV38_01625 [Candidatus Peregrinibacteria bacterium HGW-Peregrinibacteria-1]|jgi:hypothetical protein|nr:MAG: hypothetical protein CVV38_01625 [Candidatus Peregrinibacteria bacterium HGW-Peregrinibacteria-1]
MKNIKKISIFIVLVAVGFYLYLVFGSYNKAGGDLTEISMTASDVRMAENEEEVGLEDGAENEVGEVPFGVVIPSKLISDPLKLEVFYKELSDVVSPSLIVIMDARSSVDSAGVEVCVECRYVSEFGEAKVDAELAKLLIKESGIEARDAKLLNENGILVHSKMIARFYPNSKILPITLQSNLDESVRSDLADWMNLNLPEDAMVILDLGVSENVISEVAEFQNNSFVRVLRALSDVPSNLNVDCVSCLDVVMQTMKARGHEVLSELEDGIKLYLQGNGEDSAGVSFMLMGNVVNPPDFSYLRDFDYAAIADRSSFLHYFRDLQGADYGFLKGFDLMMFEVKVGCYRERFGAVTVHMCGVGSEGNELRQIMDFDEDDVVVVFRDFRGLSLSEAKVLGRKAVDEGADVVVGRGLKEIGPMELWKGGVVIYSLGDFITDSGLALSPNLSSSGVVMGVSYDDGEFSFYPFAVKIENGYPRLGDSTLQTQMNSKLIAN